jgi:hypothetical protein
MQKTMLCFVTLLSVATIVTASEPVPPTGHPDSSGWESLFAPDLSNAIGAEGVWAWKDGELSATKDQTIFSKKQYERFVVDLEFKTTPHANSGLVFYASETGNWIPHSIEIQIADTHGEKPNLGNCASIYGHVAPSKQLVKKPGEWNRLTLTCKDSMVYVVFNGELVTQTDLKAYTSAKTNPDGSPIPAHLSTPLAQLATKGHVGLQGLHGKSPMYFRNIKIKSID